MRFQVPQNLDVSDTIFFGLSFLQLFYIVGAIGWTIFVFLFLGGFLSAVFLGGPVIVFALLLSFFSFNTQSFTVVLQSVIRFFLGKKMYVWKKTDVKYMPKHTPKQQEHEVSDTEQPGKVNALKDTLLFDAPLQSSDSEPDVVI